jgi:GNS1/SUR4 family
LCYLVGVPILNKIFRALKFDGTSRLFTAITVLHNVLLVIYSGWAWYHAMPLLLGTHARLGFYGAYCDTHLAIRTPAAMAHIYLNYLSKFWEFFDTVVLIVKGKRVSLLQSYHHAGIVAVMWLLTVSRHSHGMYMVSLNAAVHTIMYTYFLGTSFGFGKYLGALRPMITTIQILQFLVGIVLAQWAMAGEFGKWAAFFPSAPVSFRGCMNPAMSAATIFTFLFLVPLIVLFANFFVRQYIMGPKKPAQKPKQQ